MKKRLSSILLALCMVLALLPETAWAAENEKADRLIPEMSSASSFPQSEKSTVSFTKNAITPYRDAVSPVVRGTSTHRYSVLLLDNAAERRLYPNVSSNYNILVGASIDKVKAAAKQFVKQVTTAPGQNYVAIVSYNTSVSVVSDFSTDYDALAESIDTISLASSSWIDTNGALLKAEQMLEQVTNTNVSKNILYFSGSLPSEGSYSTSGHYRQSDYNWYRMDNHRYIYAYCNPAYDTAQRLMSKYDVYTLGCFTNLNQQPATYNYTIRFMKDIQNAGYFNAESPGDLEFIFSDVADIIVEPVTINLNDVELIEENGTQISYRIYASVINNSTEYTITNVSAHLFPHEAEITEGGNFQTRDAIAPGKSNVFSWNIRLDKSSFADGGVYQFEVGVTSDQTVTKIQAGTISIEAVNGESNEMNFSTDVWGFKNFVDSSSCPVRDTHMSALLAGLMPTDQQTLREAIQNGFGSGHCYGMATTVILDKMNALDVAGMCRISALRSATRLSELPHSIIGYWQSTQFLKVPRAAVQLYMSMETQDQLALLAQKAAAVKDGECPVLFDFGATGWGAHAVVAYALEPGSFKSSASQKTYDHRILLYDCNVVDWKEDNCLLFNEGTDEWEIPYYYSNGVTSTNSGAYLKRCASTLDMINVKDYNSSLFNYIAELKCKNETELRLANNNGQTWIIDAKNGSIDGATDLIVYHDSDIFLDSGLRSALNITLPDESAEYILTSALDDAADFNIDVSYDNKYLSISCDSAEGIRFGENKALSLMGNKGAFEATIADNNIRSGSFNTYTVTGDSEGDVTISISSEGLVITGNDLEGIVVTAREGDVTDLLKIPKSISEANIKRNNDELVIDGAAEVPWSNPFTDVSAEAWYYDAVRFVSENDLMNGYGDGRFGPNDNLSRAQFAQILYNKEGRPLVISSSVFGDVSGGKWYTPAITWAAANGIVSGYGNGLFGPDNIITREQLAVMLCRYAGIPSAVTKDLNFTDADKVSDWALEAMLWATENGIINGKGNGILNPAGKATRAEVAQMLKNYLDK